MPEERDKIIRGNGICRFVRKIFVRPKERRGPLCPESGRKAKFNGSVSSGLKRCKCAQPGRTRRRRYDEHNHGGKRSGIPQMGLG